MMVLPEGGQEPSAFSWRAVTYGRDTRGCCPGLATFAPLARPLVQAYKERNFPKRLLHKVDSFSFHYRKRR
jgi:hypothetical protein